MTRSIAFSKHPLHALALLACLSACSTRAADGDTDADSGMSANSDTSEGGSGMEDSDTAITTSSDDGGDTEGTTGGEFPMECEGGIVDDTISHDITYDLAEYSQGVNCSVASTSQGITSLHAELSCDIFEGGGPATFTLDIELANEINTPWLYDGSNVIVETTDSELVITTADKGILLFLWHDGCNAETSAASSLLAQEWHFESVAGVCGEAPSFSASDEDQPTLIRTSAVEYPEQEVFHQHSGFITNETDELPYFELRVSKSEYTYQGGPDCYTATRFMMVRSQP